MDVHSAICKRYQIEALLTQFVEIQDAFNQLDLERVSEKDIQVLEQATNSLLKEFGTLFKAVNFGPVYDGKLN